MPMTYAEAQSYLTAPRWFNVEMMYPNKDKPKKPDPENAFTTGKDEDKKEKS